VAIVASSLSALLQKVQTETEARAQKPLGREKAGGAAAENESQKGKPWAKKPMGKLEFAL
jgi:hypothetical protein